MGLAALLKEPELNKLQNGLRRRFLRATGYGWSDVLSLNYTTGIFLTRNGGKYQVLNDRVEHLAGPAVDTEDRMEI